MLARAWLCAAMAATAAAQIHAQTPVVVSFDAPWAYYGGGYGIAVADFNGDGRPDLAVAGETLPEQYQLSIFLGASGGTLQAGPTYSVPGGFAVQVGDFNADGKVDLVVAGGSHLSILLGNGDGTFQPPQDFFAGGGISSVVVADFNGDGKLDLAVTNADSDTVSILLGKGDGTFGPATIFPVGANPASVAVGDFDGDGNLDLAVANAGRHSELGAISVLLGTGTGDFQTAVKYGSGDFQAVIASDLNGDGKLDLAAVKRTRTRGLATIFQGHGDGTFHPAVDYEVNTGPSALVAGDFDGDGYVDLAINTGTVLLNNGNGTFHHAPRSFQPPGGALVVGDFNGDGRLDLATTTVIFQCCSYRGAVYLMFGHGDGTFPVPVTTPVPGNQFSLAAGDFNGDGKLDIAVTNASALTILLGNGNGSFQPPATYNAGPDPMALAVADFNGDGKLDLAVANPGVSINQPGTTVSIIQGKGDGSFQAPVSYTVEDSPNSVQVADLNSDGKPDLVVFNNSSPTSLSILLGNGDGTFQPAINYPESDSQSVTVGDFNGDGKPDLALSVCGATGDSGVAILLGKGDGTFHAPVLYATTLCPGTLSAGDLNNDGKLDIVAAPPEGLLMFVMLGNGNGSLQPPTALSFSTQGLALADFNGDGNLDLAIVDGFLGIALGNGDGTFQPPQFLAGGFYGPLAADFYNDGKPDLAASILGGLTILKNTTK